MLKTSANTDNIIWVNASRNKTLNNPTYLMSLEHRVSGDKKYFIPQNISSFSGSTEVDPRVDIFKFGVYESGENLTGGTRAFYYQKSPSLLNFSLGTSGNQDNLYIFQQYQNLVSGTFGVYIDSINPTEYVFQAIWEIDDIPIPSGSVNIDDWGNDNIGISVSLNAGDEFFNGTKFYYRFQTNLARVFEGIIYLASMSELTTYTPWTYYGFPAPIGFPNQKFSVPIPTTYLGITNITLENYGWYYYRIYEQTSKINLNPSLTTDVVDEGTLYLYPAPPDEVSYTGYSNSEITIYDEDKVPTNHILQENEYHLLTENNELLTQE